MVNKYCCDLNALLDIFEDNLSAADVLASKALAEISSGILQCRIESGMTQKQFAQFMNVSQGMVSKWESGDYNFSVKSLADIAVKLDLDLRVCLKKSKTVQMPEKERQFRHFTTNKRRFFVIHNCVPEKEKHSYVKQYVDDTDKIKILVK